jgi:hypothetical protein
MLNANVQFSNTSNGFEAMLEAFFNVQHNEHMKAWRWHLFTRNSDMNAVDAALRDSLASLRSARNVS